MLKTRATLTLEPELHRKVKRLARMRNTSVSGLFESFLRGEKTEEVSVVDQLVGCGQLKEPSDTPNPHLERLKAKYLK